MVAVIDGVLCRGVLRFAAGLQCLLFSAKANDQRLTGLVKSYGLLGCGAPRFIC